MICLVDLGHVFWAPWHATKSAVDAYMATVQRIEGYVNQGADVVICADGRSKRRCEIYPEYKANRPRKDESAVQALRDVEVWAERNGVRYERHPEYEADDLIATYCTRCWDPIRIISEDKDLMALVDSDGLDHAMVGRKGEIGDAEVFAKFGVTPRQIPDFLALCGDTADNIPGCEKVGPGMAAKLLGRYDTIDGILAAPDEELIAIPKLGPTILANLRAWDPTLARELVRLDTDAPIRLEAA